MGVIWEAWNAQMTWNMARGWAPVRPPLQGSVGFLAGLPRALPWAGLGRTVGAFYLCRTGARPWFSAPRRGLRLPAQGKVQGWPRPSSPACRRNAALVVGMKREVNALPSDQESAPQSLAQGAAAFSPLK